MDSACGNMGGDPRNVALILFDVDMKQLLYKTCNKIITVSKYIIAVASNPPRSCASNGDVEPY